MTQRFISSVVDTGNGFAWLLYDLHKKSIVAPLCDYADDMVSKAQLSKLTVEQEMGHLRVFWAFMDSKEMDVSELSNNILKEFREFTLAQIRKSPSHRGSEEAAKTTVNAKLVRIYDWVMWLQDTQRVGAKLIGPTGCRMTSALETSAVSDLRRRDPSLTSSARYPLLFRLKAGKSKHRLAKFIPTEETLDSVHAYFHDQTTSEYLARRNCMIATIASYIGFRRASIQSLTTSQFVDDAKKGVAGEPQKNPASKLQRDFVETNHGTVLIQPLRQKFSYGDTYELPLWLHGSVKDFIVNYRNPRVEELGVGRRAHEDKIFVSDRDGRPLTDRAITALMSKAMRAVGAPKGTSIHAWRAKYAVEETAAEYESRREQNLDTSIGTMDEVLARKLGQKNPTSARAYTSAHQAAEVSRVRAQRENERHKDKLRIKALEAQLATLLRDSAKE